MEAKQINLSKSYIYGFFAAMISTLIYSAVIIPIYILLISSNQQNFMVYLLYALDVWVWIWIGISILYAFIIVLMQPTKTYSSLSKSIENLLFFIVTSIQNWSSYNWRMITIQFCNINRIYSHKEGIYRTIIFFAN